MDLNLVGKTVIVTGSGSNIGRAISLAFARDRANVVVADVDTGQGKKVVAEAEALGAKALLAPVDVTDWPAVQGMVRAAEERFGRVDVLVNNVGWTRDALFMEKTRDEWAKEIQLNLWTETCLGVARNSGGRLHGGVRVHTRRVEDEDIQPGPDV